MQKTSSTYDKVPAPDWLDTMIEYHTPKTFTEENLQHFGEILRRHKYHICKKSIFGNASDKILTADDLAVIAVNLFDVMFVYPRASKAHLAVQITSPMGIWRTVALKRPVGTYTSSKRFIIKTLSTIAGRNVKLSELRRIIYILEPYVPVCEYKIPQDPPPNTLNHFDAFVIDFLESHITDVANINKLHRLYSDWFSHHGLHLQNKRFIPLIEFKERLKQSLQREPWDHKRHYIEKKNTIPPVRKRYIESREDTP